MDNSSNDRSNEPKEFHDEYDDEVDQGVVDTDRSKHSHLLVGYDKRIEGCTDDTEDRCEDIYLKYDDGGCESLGRHDKMVTHIVHTSSFG